MEENKNKQTSDIFSQLLKERSAKKESESWMSIDQPTVSSEPLKGKIELEQPKSVKDLANIFSKGKR